MNIEIYKSRLFEDFMKVYENAGNYFVYVDRIRELPRLREIELEADLQDLDGDSLDKKFYLRFSEEAKVSNVMYVPETSNWDELKEIHFCISSFDLRNLQVGGFVHQQNSNCFHVRQGKDLGDMV